MAPFAWQCSITRKLRHKVISLSKDKLKRLEEKQQYQAGLRSRKEFLGGVGFLTTLGVGVGFFCPTPTRVFNWINFSHHNPKLGILVEMVQFLLKFLLKQRCLAMHHDFH